MKKLILFLTLLFVGISANAQYTPLNNLNYVKLLKVPPVGSVEDSLIVFDSSDSFLKMTPVSALPVIHTTGNETKAGILTLNDGLKVNPIALNIPSTVSYVGTFETDGTQGRVLPQNITIPQIPLNYTPVTATIGGHLSGIDNKFGEVLHKTGNETKSGFLTLSDKLILGETSGSPQDLLLMPANTLLKYNNTQASQYGFDITSLGADNFFLNIDEGNSRQCLLFADGDATVDSDIFGVSASQDSGVTYTKNFSITQGGKGYVKGELTAGSFKRTGGLSTQALLADGSVLSNPLSGNGVSGRIGFFNSSNNITSDNGLFWDNSSKRLGINTTLPVSDLDIRNANGGFFFDGSNATYNRIKSIGSTAPTAKPLMVSAQSSGTTPDVYIHTSGGISMGNTTDLGAGTLNVTGNVRTVPAVNANDAVVKSQLDLKANLASPTFTGDPKVPTPTAGDNDTSVVNSAFVTGAIATAKPYKVYTALISQTGTSAPTVIVLENTLGGTPVWSRIGTGVYSGLLSGFFTANKTTVIFTKQYTVPTGGTDIFTAAGCGSINSIDLSTANTAGLVDGVLSNATIEIRVYN